MARSVAPSSRIRRIVGRASTLPSGPAGPLRRRSVRGPPLAPSPPVKTVSAIAQKGGAGKTTLPLTGKASVTGYFAPAVLLHPQDSSSRSPLCAAILS